MINVSGHESELLVLRPSQRLVGARQGEIFSCNRYWRKRERERGWGGEKINTSQWSELNAAKRRENWGKTYVSAFLP